MRDILLKGDMKMRKVDFEVEFKKDLSNIEIKGIKSIVDTLQEAYIINANSDGLGLAYTSSTSYAMLGVCNGGNFKYEGNQISHFSITENNMLIMVCEDGKENLYYYEIENENFY